MYRQQFIYLDAETAYSTENYIYLFGRSINLLYRYNKKEKRVEILGQIPGRHIWERQLIGKILYWNDKIILAPFFEKSIWLFDLKVEKWTEIQLLNFEKYIMKFYQGFIHNDIAHFVGCYYPAIIRLDLNTLQIEYDTKMYEELDKVRHSDIYFRTEYIRDENNILLGCCSTNRVLQYNLDNYNYKFIELGNFEDDFEGICHIQEKLVLFGRTNRKIYLYDKKLKIDSSQKIEKCHYVATVRKNGKYMLLSNHSGKSLIWNDFDNYLLDEENCIFCEKKDEENYLYMTSKGKLIEVTQGKIEEYDCVIETEKFNNMFSNKNLFLVETPMYDLKFLLQRIYKERV